jgi:hypothetical protein
MYVKILGGVGGAAAYVFTHTYVYTDIGAKAEESPHSKYETQVHMS